MVRGVAVDVEHARDAANQQLVRHRLDEAGRHAGIEMSQILADQRPRNFPLAKGGQQRFGRLPRIG